MTLIEIRVMLKLGRRKRGHFVTLIEIDVHQIRVNPGDISFHQASIQVPCCRRHKVTL